MLAGFAIAPVFVGVMALQTRLVVQCEARNKKAREDVAKGYYDVCFPCFFCDGSLIFC
jgi:ATP-binding cassette, subfamily B (MDR/TAP), member 1